MGCKTSKIYPTEESRAKGYPGNINYIKHPNPQLRDRVLIPVHESQNKLNDKLRYNQNLYLHNIKFTTII